MLCASAFELESDGEDERASKDTYLFNYLQEGFHVLRPQVCWQRFLSVHQYQHVYLKVCVWVCVRQTTKGREQVQGPF